ncbi:MAG TPA: right-handed parallel beta-helix repeat-containing protein [Pseudonocardia sp.]|nr:right-handed parallel beta-helix repeat-containing protein [Pseudonocardia sp.]
MRRRAWLSSAVLLAVVAALGLAGCSAEQQPAPAPRIIEPAPPIPAPRTPEPAPAAADLMITPESVAGDDSTAALQAALDGLGPGQTVLFAPGEYRHAKVLTVRVPDVTIAGPGAQLIATDEEHSAFHIAADGVTVQGLSFGVQATSERWYAWEQMKVRISTAGVVLRDVTVTGSAASGIFVGDGAADFTLDHVVVRDTRADGIHITDGAHGGRVDSPLVERSGDDGVAVVSYGTDDEVSRDITVTSPTVNGTTWGRGISVVGGERITYTDVDVRDTNAAGIYLAVEGDPYNTRSVSDVRVQGGMVSGANYNSEIDHGGVLVYNGRSGEDLTGVVVDAVTVRGTRPSASQSVAIFAVDGSVSGVTLSDMVIEGGPGRPFATRGGPTDYSLDRWQVDGQAYQPD